MNIWKYPLDVAEEQTIRTPAKWNPLHVEHQDGILMLWAEVDGLGEPEVIRTIVIYGTGHTFDGVEGLTHIGSTINHARGLVWHVYMVDPR